MSQSWHCLQISAQNLFQFSYHIVENGNRRKKYINELFHWVTGSHVKPEEDISVSGQIVTPYSAKTVETGNQEMRQGA